MVKTMYIQTRKERNKTGGHIGEKGEEVLERAMITL